MIMGWSTDFSTVPFDTEIYVYATDDQGYGYGTASIWDQGNPKGPTLVWTHGHRTSPINNGVERALMWHPMPEHPGIEALDAALAALKEEK